MHQGLCEQHPYHLLCQCRFIQSKISSQPYCLLEISNINIACADALIPLQAAKGPKDSSLRLLSPSHRWPFWATPSVWGIARVGAASHGVEGFNLPPSNRVGDIYAKHVLQGSKNLSFRHKIWQRCSRSGIKNPAIWPGLGVLSSKSKRSGLKVYLPLKALIKPASRIEIPCRLHPVPPYPVLDQDASHVARGVASRPVRNGDAPQHTRTTVAVWRGYGKDTAVLDIWIWRVKMRWSTHHID